MTEMNPISIPRFHATTWSRGMTRRSKDCPSHIATARDHAPNILSICTPNFGGLIPLKDYAM